MPLKTVVKVGQVTTLNEARYCAGMGVDMLGFVAVEGQAHYLAPELYQEIRGWISGPSIVAEVFGLKSAGQIPAILKKYQPDYLEMTDSEYSLLAAQISLPCLVHVSTLPAPKSAAYLVAAPEVALSLTETARGLPPVFIRVDSPEHLLSNINRHNVGGVSICAGGNHSPLSEMLELLDMS